MLHRRAAYLKAIHIHGRRRIISCHPVPLPPSHSSRVRGLFIELGIWNENAARQSFHPNIRDHGAFAECVTAFYNTTLQNATCAVPYSGARPVVYSGLFEFKQLRNVGANQCVDGNGYDSRNNTVLQAYNCHGGRNQGFWYNPATQSLHVELSHDRCADVSGGTIAANAQVKLYNCHNGANQKWVFNGSTIRPASNSGLCLAFVSSVLRLASCSTSTNQQWAFELRRLHRLPLVLSARPVTLLTFCDV